MTSVFYPLFHLSKICVAENVAKSPAEQCRLVFTLNQDQQPIHQDSQCACDLHHIGLHTQKAIKSRNIFSICLTYQFCFPERNSKGSTDQNQPIPFLVLFVLLVAVRWVLLMPACVRNYVYWNIGLVVYWNIGLVMLISYLLLTIIRWIEIK